MLWSLWAAKEAAYKALSRGVDHLVFSPIQFEVLPDPGAGTATVTHGDQGLTAAWAQGPDWVHAWVSDDIGRITTAVDRRPEAQDESSAVRALALRTLKALGAGGGTIEGRPPVFVGFNREPLALSLSHDGPWCAVALFRP